MSVAPIREYQTSIYQDDARDPYGFGMRVVGTTSSAGNNACARVLWIAPGGPAYRAGIKVGDRVSTAHPHTYGLTKPTKGVPDYKLAVELVYLSFLPSITPNTSTIQG